MTQPLMPKATAVWLIENTALSFEQVADFCQLHSLEVQAIADGEVSIGMPEKRSTGALKIQIRGWKCRKVNCLNPQ